MTQYILINGPAGVGKDTLGAMLREQLALQNKKAIIDKFAAPLKRAVAAFMNLSDAEFQFYFETPEKNQPQRRFYGQTPRQALINFSEQYAKMTFGGRVFSMLCLDRNRDNDLVIITDCGFEIEADTIFAKAEKVLLVRLVREGLTFAGDSREYVQNHPYVEVRTDCDVGDSLRQLMTAANDWMKQGSML